MDSNGIELKDTMQITYYCSRRHKYFYRTVRVDRSLEIQRKLNGAILQAVHNSQRNAASIMLKQVGGTTTMNKAAGESASVPAYLFGKEYFRAHRVNPADVWDFRKEAFAPLETK